MNQVKAIIVIGASAGGLQAVSNLLQTITTKLDAAIFVVLHVSKNSSGNVLIQHLQKKTNFKCSIPEDGAPILAGHLYLARPDFHLVITQGFIKLTHGPHENRWRPSINVLFRSAAASYNANVIGIILTGLLDDGAAGMEAIKRCGGVCIVQEPDEAQFADMPNNVLNRVEVDYRVPISDMGYILDDMDSKPLKSPVNVPDDIRIEAELTEKMVSGIDHLKQIGVQSDYTCPDCGGSLFQLKNDKISRYRCFTGHVYTEKLLLDKQAESLEDSLWITIRRLEERKSLFRTIINHPDQYQKTEMEAENLKKISEIKEHIERLKNLITSLSNAGLIDNTEYE